MLLGFSGFSLECTCNCHYYTFIDILSPEILRDKQKVGMGRRRDTGKYRGIREERMSCPQ